MKIIFPNKLNSHEKAAIYLHDIVFNRSFKIKNLSANLALLDTGSHKFPLTINEGDEVTASGEINSYVVSPLAAYTNYALEELRRLDSLLPKWPLVLIIKVIRVLLKWAVIDRIVHINNWVLSTNIYPADWKAENIADITQLMLKEFPQHAIAFRSLNEMNNEDLTLRMSRSGYLIVPSRQVYLFDFSTEKSSQGSIPHNCKIDERLLKKSGYKVVDARDLPIEAFIRMEDLYNFLYLDKYCRLNPQYTAEWLKAGCESGWLELRVLQSQKGVIDGVVGWFSNENFLTAPIVGYDTNLPQATGLYRMLTHLCIAEARKRKTILNFSSGAAYFKRLRGGTAAIEHTLVYVKHLSLRQRCVWHFLSGALHLIAVPIMKKLKL